MFSSDFKLIFQQAFITYEAYNLATLVSSSLLAELQTMGTYVRSQLYPYFSLIRNWEVGINRSLTHLSGSQAFTNI